MVSALPSPGGGTDSREVAEVTDDYYKRKNDHGKPPSALVPWEVREAQGAPNTLVRALQAWQTGEGDEADSLKSFASLNPTCVSAASKVLEFGAKKYAPHSWRTVPDAIDRYRNALWRHWDAHMCGESLDQESELSHLAHMYCNAIFLFALLKKDD